MQIIKQHSQQRRPSFVEMYGAGNIVDMSWGRARNLNINGMAALDLRTRKPNGEPLDFTKRSDRLQAYRLVVERKPTWVLGSPPCGPFSSWQNINCARMEPEERLRQLEEGRMHLQTSAPPFHINVDMAFIQFLPMARPGSQRSRPNGLPIAHSCWQGSARDAPKPMSTRT